MYKAQAPFFFAALESDRMYSYPCNPIQANELCSATCFWGVNVQLTPAADRMNTGQLLCGAIRENAAIPVRFLDHIRLGSH